MAISAAKARDAAATASASGLCQASRSSWGRVSTVPAGNRIIFRWGLFPRAGPRPVRRARISRSWRRNMRPAPKARNRPRPSPRPDGKTGRAHFRGRAAEESIRCVGPGPAPRAASQAALPQMSPFPGPALSQAGPARTLRTRPAVATPAASRP